MKDAKCAESNEKSSFQFLDLVYFVLKFGHFPLILRIKSTITQNIKTENRFLQIVQRKDP